MTEFIGSRISLISRSDIRYVGTLNQIDSDNSTVGLENVTNHGTEGRCADPANEVDGTDEIYDYIVFRGSDVKDLRMEPPETAPKPAAPPSFPNDPAIINAQRPAAAFPPQQLPYQPNGRPGQPPFPPNFPQGFYPHPSQMPPGGRFYGQPPFIAGGYPGGPPNPGFPPGAFPYGMPPPFAGPLPPSQNPQNLPSDGRNRAGTQTRLPPGQNSAAPAPGFTKAELPAVSLDNKEKAVESKPSVQQAPPPPLESKPDVATALAQPTAAPSTQPAGPRNTANRGRGGPRGRGTFGGSHPGHTQTGPAVTTNTAAAPVLPIFPTPPPVGAAAQQQTVTESPGLADLERKVQAMKLKQAATVTPQPRPNHDGPAQYRGRGRGRGGPPNQPRKVEVPTTDYDFESANARFTKVADSGDAIGSADAGEGPSSGREAPTEQDSKPAILTPVDKYYNKGTSFFDNISCENKERVEAKESGVDNRQGPHRRSEEVKKNIETFGQGSVDSGYNRRGGWRGGRGGRGGRGNFRGRGRGGGPSQPVKASG